MSITLGIDIGTSGTKTLAIDEKGTILAAATAEYPCDIRGQAGRSRIRTSGGRRPSRLCSRCWDRGRSARRTWLGSG